MLFSGIPIFTFGILLCKAYVSSSFGKNGFITNYEGAAGEVLLLGCVIGAGTGMALYCNFYEDESLRSSFGLLNAWETDLVLSIIKGTLSSRLIWLRDSFEACFIGTIFWRFDNVGVEIIFRSSSWSISLTLILILLWFYSDWSCSISSSSVFSSFYLKCLHFFLLCSDNFPC